MRKTPLLLVPIVLLSACTWGIKLDDAAKNVHTAWNGDVSGCRDMGKVTVSVMDRVGPVDRNDIKVRDELEVMARNEAAKMNADTIKALSDPTDGSQPWGAYLCGGRGSHERERPIPSPDSAPPGNSSPPPPQAGGFESYPAKGG
jgi:Domain of unknown function (DUF4156)